MQVYRIPVHHTKAVTELSILRHAVEQNRPLNLLELLKRSVASEATDPRDKVHALLGICSDVNGELRPNYEISTVELFRNALLLYLHRGRLDMLAAVSYPRWRLTKGLPSWAPDRPFKPRTRQVTNQVESANVGGSPIVRQGDQITITVTRRIVDSIRMTGYWMTPAYSDIFSGLSMERCPDKNAPLVSAPIAASCTQTHNLPNRRRRE